MQIHYICDKFHRNLYRINICAGNVWDDIEVKYSLDFVH